MWDLYLTNFRRSLALNLQYRGSILIWGFATFMQPLILLVVWVTVARSMGGAVGGYSAPEFAAYFITALLVNHLTFTWIMWEFEFRIRNGSFAALLLRPVHPIHGDVADNIAYKLLILVVMLPAAALIAWIFDAQWNLQPWAVAAFIPALVLAAAVRFMVEWTLALAAFWVVRVAAINQLFFAISFFLSGQMAPISLLPTPVQVLAQLLPFRWFVSFPVELLLGRLSPREALLGFGAQLIWLLLAFGLLKLLWRASTRRFTAVGS